MQKSALFMLLTCHLKQDLCATTHKRFASINTLQNPHGKMRTSPSDTFRKARSHRNRRLGGNPHVTDIIPLNFFRAGSNEEQNSHKFPIEKSEIKGIHIENGAQGHWWGGIVRSTPCPQDAKTGRALAMPGS